MILVKCTNALMLLVVICISCTGQNNSQQSASEKAIDRDKRLKIKDYKVAGIHTETESNGVIIQNSYPKGDRYSASNGTSFGVAIFWTRVINEGTDPLELSLDFFSGSLAVLGSPDSSLKLFLLPDTMTLDKVSLYSYGITDLKPCWIQASINRPRCEEKLIQKGSACS